MTSPFSTATPVSQILNHVLLSSVPIEDGFVQNCGSGIFVLALNKESCKVDGLNILIFWKSVGINSNGKKVEAGLTVWVRNICHSLLVFPDFFFFSHYGGDSKRLSSINSNFFFRFLGEIN